MSEPEVALVFTPELWVEELHRHLSDHGGARVISLVVEPSAALDEQYDVLVVGHRWVALTAALVADVHARGRSVIGVYDRDEPAGQRHLVSLGVDAAVASDEGSAGLVTAIGAAAGRRDRDGDHVVEDLPRSARLVAVGGPPGVGRTEIAIQLALALRRRAAVTLADCDDVAPAIAQRLGIPIEPNLRTAIEAVEHRRGNVGASVREATAARLAVLAGIPNPSNWARVRPGEVLRVLDRLGDHFDLLVADGAGALDVVGPQLRDRNATARMLLLEADAVVAVCDASPVGITRLTAWLADAVQLAPEVPYVVVVNRAPSSRFRRGEIYEELRASAPAHDIVFVPYDRRVGDAAWNGTATARGPFTRAVEPIAALVDELSRRASDAERRRDALIEHAEPPAENAVPLTQHAGPLKTLLEEAS